MIFDTRSNIRNRTLSVVVGLILTWSMFMPQSWSQTSVSGKVFTADGRVVASGAVALEKGALHNNRFLSGGAIDMDGTFRIPLPSGGLWGLHVYSEKYIYFPLQIQITEATDNDIPVVLPVDSTSADDPRISNIRFTKLSDQVFQITMQVQDPDGNLGPQMLAIDTKRFKSYRLVPKAGDLKDKKAEYPNAEYDSPFIPVALDGENLRDWLLVVADHQCSNGAIYNGLGESIFKPTVVHAETLTCDMAGIWKSNFDKVYRFLEIGPGVLKGEQFEGNLFMDNMVQKGADLSIAFRFGGQTGSANLTLHCQEDKVLLKGVYQYPDRSGDWIFTKLKNTEAPISGKNLFAANCSTCHYPDRKDQKIGPGLQALFKNPKLPTSGLSVSEDTVVQRIIQGGVKMPPFRHLDKEELKAIVDYLKTL